MVEGRELEEKVDWRIKEAERRRATVAVREEEIRTYRGGLLDLEKENKNKNIDLHLRLRCLRRWVLRGG